MNDWYAIPKEVKGDLFFPNLLFDKIKHIEKQLNYGPKFQEYYWMNTANNLKHDLEYNEKLKITSFCVFDFSTFPFDSHKCELILGSSYVSGKN